MNEFPSIMTDLNKRLNILILSLQDSINVSKNTTTFNYVSALSSANFPVANVTGIANITIIDHFASNTSAQTIDLSAVTDVANIATFYRTTCTEHL